MRRLALLALTVALSAPTPANEASLVVFMPPSKEELEEVALPDLRDELLQLASDDQRARLAGGCGSEGEPTQLDEVDRRNTARFRQLVEQHGWPTVAMAGSDGARAAWLLAQHADHDLDWQREALALMEPHAGNGQADPIDLAYLTDRVRVNEGRPQLYGTQFHHVDGKRAPRPIEDPEGVDARRKGLGMRSLEAYTKFVNT